MHSVSPVGQLYLKGGDVNVIGFVVTNVVRDMMNAPVSE